jgi:site-specific recombinase XerD
MNKVEQTDVPTLIREYLNHLETREYSSARRRNVLSKLRILDRFCSHVGIEVSAITVHSAREYQGWVLSLKTRHGKPYAKTSVRNILSHASAFYDYLVHTAVVSDNPFTHLPGLRTEKPVVRNIPSVSDMQKLLDALRQGWTGTEHLKERISAYRFHILSEILYASGLRISEAAELRISELDLGSGMIHLTRTKGGKARIAFLSSYACELLEVYLQQLLPLIRSNWHDETTVFGTGTEQFAAWANTQLVRWCRRCDIPRFTAHGFRHALGYHLLKYGCPIRSIQEILGHRKIRSTEVYTQVDKEDLRSVLDRYHPLSSWSEEHPNAQL